QSATAPSGTIPGGLSKKPPPRSSSAVFSNEDYLAELLTEAGMVSIEQVDQARNAMSSGESLIEHLVAHTGLTEVAVAQTLAANAGIPFINLEDVSFDPSI